MPDETEDVGLMASIDEALGAVTEAPAQAAAAEPPATEESAASPEGGEEAQHEDEGAEGGEPEGEQEGQDKEAAGGKKPEELAAKAPDALNDPIPKDLSQETQTRIRSLVKTAREASAAREKAQTDFDYLVQGVRATGTTPAQYGEILSWMAMFNSRDPQQQRKALELAEDTCERLAMLLGVERKASDPLAQHADLQQSVQEGKATREIAVQLARQRDATQFRQSLQSEGAKQAQSAQQAQQEAADARAKLTEIGNRLGRTDPRFAEKRDILVRTLRPLFQRLPHREWAAAFEEAYKELRLAPRSAGSAVPGNQPLRQRSPAGGNSKPAASALEAMDQALQSMN